MLTEYYWILCLKEKLYLSQNSGVNDDVMAAIARHCSHLWLAVFAVCGCLAALLMVSLSVSVSWM